MEKPASRGPTGSTPLTTFVQADTNTFRELVQRLTGPSDRYCQTSAAPAPAPVPVETANEWPSQKVVGVKKPTFKLHERRQYMRSKLEIVKPAFQFKPASPVLPLLRPGLPSPEPSFPPSKFGSSGFLTSPSSTPSKTFSNLSLLEEEKEKPASSNPNKEEEEEKAIKERRFYLHPSPRSRPGYTEPELLTLFPLRSPRITDES
ncbi:hypothetical protein HHK36_004575 [Tetracentron sinense]|uniref:VQ domain-containing protein n=1 Tax=Tetracentron sinense TaxID=13715 RepID=A0A834ZRF5_TETSI|nr:hypothetical protein HHK36_004575 [Tetracentron sinense]